MSTNPCDGCPLRGTSHKLKAVGKRNAKFLIVSKSPYRNSHFSADAEQVLFSNLKAVGFKKEDFVIASSVRCSYDPKSYPSKDRKLIETHCRKWLERVIVDLRPKAILSLGADATRAVYGKGVKITKVRGLPEYLDEFDTHVVPTFDPIAVHLYPQHIPLFESDCNTFKRLVDYNFNVSRAEKQIRGEYTEVDDLQFLIDLEPSVLAYDLETLGMRWAEPECKILTMQFCTEPGKAYLLSWDHPGNPKSQRQKSKLKAQLKQLLQNPRIKILGQNLKYDANWTVNRLGIKFKISHNTIMLAALVDENAQSIGLDTLTKVYAPALGGYADSFNSKYDKSRMDLVPLSELINYGCGDVDATFRVFQALYGIVSNDPRLLNHYNKVSIPGINAFLSIEQRGLLIDPQALDDFEKVLSAEVEDRYHELLKQVPRSIKRKHLALKKDPRKALSFSRREFVLDILFRHPDGFKLTPTVFTKDTANLEDDQKIPSTSSKDHLPYFYDTCQFTQQLSEYIKVERVLSTNVRSFRKKYMIGDHIYPSYTLWKAVTGRSTSEDPNSQNFPKRGKAAKAYRKIFIPPPGYMMLEADLSQAELRISSSMAGEDTMIGIYSVGGDIHRTTACVVLGITESKFDSLPKEERDLARFKAKAVNFGFIYGMGWRKFIIYAYTQYGVRFTEREARRIREAFFSKYSRLSEWHKQVRQFVHRHGYVRSYSGRVRHLPMVNSEDEGICAEAERQGINCLSDDTEILTVDGWKTVDQVHVGDGVYSVNPETREMELDIIQNLHVGNVDREMHYFEHNAFSAIATPNHRWLIDHKGNKNIVSTRFRTSDRLRFTGSDKVWIASDGMRQDTVTAWTDDEVRLIGWVLTDGYYKKQRSKKTGKEWGVGRVGISQVKPANLEAISSLMYRLGKHSHRLSRRGQHFWDITCEAGFRIREMMPGKILTPEVLNSLNHEQRVILYETMLTGDGSFDRGAGRYRKFTCATKQQADMFLMLCAMIGQAARAGYRDMSMYAPVSAKMDNVPKMSGVWLIELAVNKRAQVQYGHRKARWAGRVWCPTTRNGTWVARRNGKVFITGNSPVQEFASTLGVIAFSRLDQEIDPRYLSVSGFVHDAIYAYVPMEYVEWGAKTLRWYMESTPLKKWFGLTLPVPIIADVSFGINGASMNEMKNLSYKETFDFSPFTEKLGFELPAQKTPPNKGKIILPDYLNCYA